MLLFKTILFETHNNTNDLMAVAKLSRPLKKITGIPMTFKVQIDI